MRTLRSRTTLLALILLGSTGCGGDGPAPGSLITFDTLPNGAMLVSNPVQGMWSEGEEWRLEEEVRIGGIDASGPAQFGSIPAIAAHPDGRILVLDNQARELRIFSAEGTHLQTLGRDGSGPGEFRTPIGLAVDGAGNIWVQDPGNARYTVFREDGSLLATHPRQAGYFAWPWPGGLDREDRIWDVLSGGTLTRLSPDFTPADSIPIPEDSGPRIRVVRSDGAGMMSMVPPYASWLRWQFDPRGYLWWGVSDRYRFIQQSAAGDTVRIIQRDHTPVAVTPVEADSVREDLRTRIASFGSDVRVEGDQSIPPFKPAFQSFHLDADGYLWVDPFRELDAPRFLDLFDPEGRYLGQVAAPTGLQLQTVRPEVRGAHLLAVVNDEFDVATVVRYRIAGK